MDLQRALPHQLIGSDGQKRVLDAVWQKIERAIKGLGSEIVLPHLTRVHILELGGYLVDSSYWLSLQHESFDTWDEFKARVNADWALTNSAQRTWFFAMRPHTGESNPSFILRVNAEGNRLGVSAGERLRNFEPLLSEAVVDQVTAACISGAVLGAGDEEVQWRHYVAFAQRVAMCPKLQTKYSSRAPTMPTAPVPTPCLPPAAPARLPPLPAAPPAATPLPTVPVVSIQLPGPPPLHGLVKEPCKLCSLLGRSQANTHTWEDCFANPKGSKCKPGVYRQRMGDLVFRNMAIPDYMNHRLPEALLKEEKAPSQNHVAQVPSS